MKNTAGAVFFLAFLVSSISAQFVSPLPVIETEMRDRSSVKIRSIELERVKRDARKPRSEKIAVAGVNNFLEIKQDFEKIQILENNLVKVYTTGKQIEYAQIATFSGQINESAARLKKNLFPARDNAPAKSTNELKAEEKPLPDGVKNLIVELDNRIGEFVGNPIFIAPKKAGSREMAQAEAALKQVIILSDALKREAERQTRPKN